MISSKSISLKMRKLRHKEIEGLVQEPIASGSLGFHLASSVRPEGRIIRTLYVIPVEPA